MGGFFKNDKGEIVYAPNFVKAPGFTLIAKNRLTYTYPVDGWQWFDDDVAAYKFFGSIKPSLLRNTADLIEKGAARTAGDTTLLAANITNIKG